MRVAVAPLQITTTAGAIAATGFEFIVTILDVEAVQLFASVTVTKYVVGNDGETVMLADVEALLHE